MNHAMTRQAGLFLIFASLLTGCASTPDFKPPAIQTRGITLTDAATAHPKTSGTPEMANDPWWKNPGAPRLDALIKTALQNSPTLAAAQATLRQAEELHAAQTGATRYPQIDASLGTQRQRMNPASQGLTGEAREFTLHNASLGLRYRLDLAGGNQRALEALAARVDYRRHELDDARLILAASIARAAITRASLADQIDATRAMIDAQDEQFRILVDRIRLGQASASEGLALQGQIEQNRAALPLLQQQLQKTEHLLATLSGQSPDKAHLPPFTLDEFRLPARLPTSLPSRWLRHRPDIQAAEALLNVATAEYGVAAARLYPQINLSAGLGTQALSSAALFGGGSAVWSLVGQLTQPLFNPGLPAEKRAALAALDAAAANYQRVVQDALRDAADTLSALEQEASSINSLTLASTAAQELSDITDHQHTLGVASESQRLVARQQALQARINLNAAQARQLGNSVDFYQATGMQP